MIAYIDEVKHGYGVEPICRVLPIAPPPTTSPPVDPPRLELGATPS